MYISKNRFTQTDSTKPLTSLAQLLFSISILLAANWTSHPSSCYSLSVWEPRKKNNTISNAFLEFFLAVMCFLIIYPFLPCFLSGKNTKLSSSTDLFLATMETITSRAKHSQTFSYKTEKNMFVVFWIIFIRSANVIHIEGWWKQNRLRRQWRDMWCHHGCQTCPFPPEGSSVDGQICSLLMVEKQRASRALRLWINIIPHKVSVFCITVCLCVLVI